MKTDYYSLLFTEIETQENGILKLFVLNTMKYIRFRCRMTGFCGGNRIELPIWSVVFILETRNSDRTHRHHYDQNDYIDMQVIAPNYGLMNIDTVHENDYTEI